MPSPGSHSNVRIFRNEFHLFDVCAFSGKDIEVALTEIRELKNNIKDLIIEEKSKENRIKNLLDDRAKLEGSNMSKPILVFYQLLFNRTLQQYQIELSTARPQLQPFCSYNRCFTPTESAMLGVGAVIVGAFIGVLLISWLQHQV